MEKIVAHPIIAHPEHISSVFPYSNPAPALSLALTGYRF